MAPNAVLLLNKPWQLYPAGREVSPPKPIAELLIERGVAKRMPRSKKGRKSNA